MPLRIQCFLYSQWHRISAEMSSWWMPLMFSLRSLMVRKVALRIVSGIKSDENAEPHMTHETYRFVMSWNYYPEPVTGELQVNLGVHTRMPDFSVLNFKDGVRCFPAYGPT